MTRLGILLGGLVLFASLLAACIWEHRSGIAAAPAAAAAVTLEPILLPAPMLRLEFDSRSLVLTGRLADAAMRDAIVRRAQALYGAAQVHDRIQIIAVAPASWLAAAEQFPPDLRTTRHATALLQEGRLIVEGETNTDADRAGVDRALERSKTSGILLDVRLDSSVAHRDVEHRDEVPFGGQVPASAPTRRTGSRPVQSQASP